MSPALVLRLWRIAAVVVTSVVLVLLLLPGHRLPAAAFTGLDEVAHLGSWALVGLTWHRAGLPMRWVIGLGLALAGGTELAQGTLVPGRQPDVRDLVANVVGLAAGVALSAAAPGGSGPRADGGPA